MTPLRKFLNAYKSSTNYTHLSLQPNGKYVIPNTKYDELYALIANETSPPHILEGREGLTGGPLLIDLDFEYPDEVRVLREPHRYAWNILLREHQFTQDELLAHRDYIPLPEMIRFQHAVTLPFLRTFFAVDIDICLEVDWEDCKKWVEARDEGRSA